MWPRPGLERSAAFRPLIIFARLFQSLTCSSSLWLNRSCSLCKCFFRTECRWGGRKPLKSIPVLPGNKKPSHPHQRKENPSAPEIPGSSSRKSTPLTFYSLPNKREQARVGMGWKAFQLCRFRYIYHTTFSPSHSLGYHQLFQKVSDFQFKGRHSGWPTKAQNFSL